ncbi:MAG: hypothetical protein M3065_19380, partial [Actinomycetota bacterium]|nr:hypothetical protein [Actinomycetota bacterium]
VDTSGVVTFDPASPSSAARTTIDQASFLNAIACPSTSECVAVDSADRAIVGDPGNPASWTIERIAGANDLKAVACSSVGQCVAVDQVGQGFVGVEPPASTAPPSISGSAVQGQTLTEIQGSYTHSPTSFAYQWQDCDTTGASCSAIAGATGQSYTLTGSDVGHTIRVQETASNAGGASALVSSAQTVVVKAASTMVPVSSSPPSISGSAVQGHRLTEKHGSYTHSPTSFAYRWQRCDAKGNGCTAISGATGQRYTLSGADVSHRIRVREIASNAAGTGGAVSSKPTALVSSNHAPALTRYRITNRTFAVAGRRTPRVGRAAAKRPKPKLGTAFKYTLSAAATVKIVISTRVPGRRRGRRCIAPSRRPGKAKRCTRIVKTGTLTRASHPGANTVAFSGRIAAKALKPGRYQATITATNPAKHTAKPQTISFTIIPR